MKILCSQDLNWATTPSMLPCLEKVNAAVGYPSAKSDFPALIAMASHVASWSHFCTNAACALERKLTNCKSKKAIKVIWI